MTRISPLISRTHTVAKYRSRLDLLLRPRDHRLPLAGISFVANLSELNDTLGNNRMSFLHISAIFGISWHAYWAIFICPLCKKDSIIRNILIYNIYIEHKELACLGRSEMPKMPEICRKDISLMSSIVASMKSRPSTT